MGLIVNISDFESGKYPISFNTYTKADLVKYLDQYELNYLEDLLGKELSDLFIADMAGTGAPTNLDYLIIFNRLVFDLHCNQWRSNGIKEMLIGFIWCEFVKDQNTKQTLAGTVQQQTEVSEVVSLWNAQYQERYNFALGSYHSIQIYICDNSEKYPEYNGTRKQALTFL